jgi:rubrerythrin
LTWDVFITQFERRFYPVTFLEKMKIDLQSFKQEKKSVTEYEVGFNKIVRFVPHVAYNELEKASQFHKGLKPSIKHALSAFPLVDFRTTVEQALGVKMQHQYTMKSQKSSCVDQPRVQDARRGNTRDPSHKRGKSQHQCHHPYRGKPSESGTSEGSTQRWAVPKPRLGLVCFHCGEVHRRAECQWSGRCSICSQDHKDVVCRRNPNGKLKWEPVNSSSSQGTVNMMSSAKQQFSVSPPQQQFYMPGTP